MFWRVGGQEWEWGEREIVSFKVGISQLVVYTWIEDGREREREREKER